MTTSLDSRAKSIRSLRILDSQTRVRYLNQRESTKLRRKLIDINMKETHCLAQWTSKRHDIKMKLYEIQHEIDQRALQKKANQCTEQTSASSNSEVDTTDESYVSSLDGSSLLLHNLSGSNYGQKSFILPSKSSNISSGLPSLSSSTPTESHRSKYENSFNSFQQTRSFIISDNLSLKQITEQMKRSIKMAIAKSARDAHILSRRNFYSH